ncbi:haloacid dehalogenase type II [Mycolicibacterium fluoranthenivorans]|uniref:2-haloacid dehalogenase n=1 Tax=Mycolicibacterium fluoranthenivorans TaxID=258505 RepID=A0A7X5U0T1_9MYCO|nr:haloacid dehalogenase type II [Mycolicibacterium fluoranthenivorans]MCV7359893.1 haloacid dehalogenase type II [Mycolicibacterium fluoranthenivorans]NIH96305.1 2-haloacid dehalogenase [Mycolicibacterium fluoranthenivorans]
MRFRAYLFDVQGTLLDFFGPVSRAVKNFLDANQITTVDAGEFTRDWRTNYFHRVRTLSQSVDQWHPVQREYAAGFGEVCVSHGLAEPTWAAAESVASSWQRLEPWPDARAGMARLRRDAITATLSNTDMSTMVSLFKNLAIDIDAVLTAELVGAFKPDPRTYLRALQYLGVQPHETAMVACHPYDLDAAASLGLGTVFLSRPHEYGDPHFAHEMTAGSVDQVVRAVGDIR